MIQKMIVVMLVLTVLGAAGLGIYESTKSDDETSQPDLLVNDIQPAVEAEMDSIAADAPVSTEPEAPALAPTSQPESQMQAVDQVGDLWQGEGMITALDNNGITLDDTTAGEIYIELGPANYWQAGTVTLAVGDTVRVEGFFNGEQYHAMTVTTSDGSTLAVRTADGQPMWSGGSQNGNGNQNSQDEPLVALEDWVTVEGTITATTSNILTLQTEAGDTLDAQLGQPSFVETQSISFAVGDAVSVLGFWQIDQFKAGEITKIATGERLMLLDPNGRPLWGGPGRSDQQSGGQGQGQSAGGQGQGGQGGQGQAQSAGGQGQSSQSGQGQAQNTGGQGQSSQGGQGRNSQGGGYGYQGGRNQVDTE